MWSFVARKSNPRWLWHAIDHHTGKVLAYVFGRRQDAVFLQLKALLEPFGITRYYIDGWGAYDRHIEAEQHTVGKENTQKGNVSKVEMTTFTLPVQRHIGSQITRSRCHASASISRSRWSYAPGV